MHAYFQYLFIGVGALLLSYALMRYFIMPWWVKRRSKEKEK